VIDKKYIIIAVITIFILVLGYFIINKNISDDLNEDKESIVKEKIVFLELKEFILNINTDNTNTRFLKLSISLELNSNEDRQKLMQILPKIRDSIHPYIRDIRFEDINGSYGIYKMKEELLRRVNYATYPIKVNEILFNNLLVQ